MAPVIPIGAETKPENNPNITLGVIEELVLIFLTFSWAIIKYAPKKYTTTEKNKTKIFVFIVDAKNVPAKTPITTKIPKVFTTLKSTSLFLLCVITDTVDVKIVIVKAVPTVKCIKKFLSKFNVSKIKNKQGTEINPPPIPKRPAKKPTALAANTINKKKCQYSFIKNVKDR